MTIYTKLKQISISDLKAMNDYCLYQCEHRPWELTKWSNRGIKLVDEIEIRMDSLFNTKKNIDEPKSSPL